MAPSIGLVLGSGGVLGSSFHAGVLLALAEEWGIDGRKSSEVLGTSAGSITGALLAAGLSPQDLARREHGLSMSRSGKAVLARRTPLPSSTNQHRSTGHLGPAESPRMRGAGWPAAPQLGFEALRAPGSVMPGTVLAGMLPRGSHSTRAIETMVDEVLQGSWPSTVRLRCAAVNLRSGQRQVFSDTGAASVGGAVAASCAVPGIHEPVTIDGAEFIDGAVHSVNNLDAVGHHDIVVVSSPSTASLSRATAASDAGAWPLAAARNLAHLQLLREIDAVASKTTLVVIEPDQSVLDAMGTDPMATSRRAAVAVAAHRLATTIFKDRANPVADESH